MERRKVQLEAAAVADELMRLNGGPEEPLIGLHRNRQIAPELRQRFVKIRDRLIQLGINDPILARFDSHTVAQEETSAVARQLAAVAENLL